jgi:transmembrane sensor
MQPTQLKSFLERFAIGEYTEGEHQQFIEWSKNASMAEVEAIMEEYNISIAENYSSAGEVDLNLASHIEAAIDQYELGKEGKSKGGKIIHWPFLYRIVAASLILFISGTAAYFAFRTTKHNIISKSSPRQLNNELTPGTNKAILTLSDGSNIILDDAKNGQVAQQGNTQVSKLANGQLVYNSLADKPTEVVFNTLTTPRGGQFKLTLPDGSQVWLNAASSIKYPTAFVGNERRVEISGEAYFEIAPLALPTGGGQEKIPFIVKINTTSGNGGEVKVLGTHFNINAYNDEASVKTTLLEGSVKVMLPSSKGGYEILKPGQQAQVNNSPLGDGDVKVINNVDVDQVVAWKNGYFSFNRAGLQTVMRQIARWYDVEISYEGKIPEREFGGKIDRSSNASEVLKILEESKVHFRIEEKKIIVRP